MNKMSKDNLFSQARIKSFTLDGRGGEKEGLVKISLLNTQISQY